MSFTQTALLGALSGFTIYLGLPVGRVRVLGVRSRVAMAMFAVGVLAFILVDVLSHATATLGAVAESVAHGRASAAHLAWVVLVLGGSFTAGCAGIAAFERGMRPVRRRPPPIAGGAVATLSPSQMIMNANEVEAVRRRALRTGLTIATAIGVHNLAEGLAIGVSAATGQIRLATVLIVGFALHNATEGFGIVGPLGDVRPRWRWLGLMGLIGGGPTFLGSLLGYGVTSGPLELASYAGAGGAILYVIGEVWSGMRRHGHRELGLLMLSLGFLVGVCTDLIVSLGGG
jgi:ZIP family zinc transporter